MSLVVLLLSNFLTRELSAVLYMVHSAFFILRLSSHADMPQNFQNGIYRVLKGLSGHIKIFLMHQMSFQSQRKVETKFSPRCSRVNESCGLTYV